MKIKLFTTAFFALFSVAFLTNASAQSTPQISKSQVKQNNRIKQGAKSGALTNPEIVQLKMQQKQIQRTKKKAKADGKVTPRERTVIRSQQKAASRNIHHQKNDVQQRR